MRILLFALASSLLLLAVGRAAADERPNVLFLFADDQRADTIAALGNHVMQTPNLDKLAQRGFVMKNAYCMGSTMGAVCNPSRHMVLSGMSLYRYDPKKKEDTWGDVFRKAGYETYHLSKKGNTAREYHKAFATTGYLDDFKERESGHHGRTAADRAIEFVEDSWNQEQPLFMYVGFTGPHDPRVAAEKWMDLYDRDEIPLPPNYAPFHAIDNGWMTGRDEKLAPWPRTPEVVRRHLHDYYACISSIDHHVGRILQAFEKQGQLENTIVIYSGDHGLAMGSHGLFGKQNLYDHSMESPLIFAGPGIEAGSSKALMYLFDIFPTACELAGIEPPASIEGRSAASVIRGDQEELRDEIFLAYESGQRALRQSDWKLYRFPLVNQTMLFNLADDPHETKNLAENPQQANRVRKMMASLAEAQQHWDDTQPLTSPDPGEAKIDISFFPQPKK